MSYQVYEENAKMKKTIRPYIYLIPSFFLLAVFYYYAVVYAFGLSLTDTVLGLGGHFTGLNNYKRLFEDPVFWQSIKNLAKFACADFIKALSFPLIAAELLFFVRRERISNVMKRVLIFPMLVPGMVTMMIWYNMLDPNIGIVNQLLSKLGLVSWQHNWFFDSKTAIWSIIAIGFPFVAGLNFLIYHTALNTIPKEQIEAAELDGCTKLKTIWYIHVPTIIPYAGTVSILALIGSLSNYAHVLVTTKGGPGYSTYVPALIMYNNMNSDVGYAATAGVFCFLLIMVVTIIIRRLVSLLHSE